MTKDYKTARLVSVTIKVGRDTVDIKCADLIPAIIKGRVGLYFYHDDGDLFIPLPMREEEE